MLNTVNGSKLRKQRICQKDVVGDCDKKNFREIMKDEKIESAGMISFMKSSCEEGR